MGYNGVMSDSQHTDLLPAYLAVGEDALKREAVIARLKARLGTMGDMAFNSDEFDGEVAEGAAIAAACNTMPFASPVRLVYVRNADKLPASGVEVLKVGHHGSKKSLDASLAERLSPKVALIGVGEANRYGHPSQNTLDFLEKTGCATYRSDESGDVVVAFSEDTLTVSTQR